MSVATIRLPETLSEDLIQLAKVTQSSCAHPVIQVVKKYVVRAHTDAERWQETLAVLESGKAGRLTQGEEVNAWLSGWSKTTPKKSRR